MLIYHDLEFVSLVSSEFDKDYKNTFSLTKSYIKKVLDTVGNNKTKAAEILGIDRKTLRNKMSD